MRKLEIWWVLFFFFFPFRSRISWLVVHSVQKRKCLISHLWGCQILSCSTRDLIYTVRVAMGESIWSSNSSYLWVSLSPILIDQWISTGDPFALRGHLTISGNISACHNFDGVEGSGSMVFSGRSLGILLNSLPCTGWERIIHNKLSTHSKESSTPKCWGREILG